MTEEWAKKFPSIHWSVMHPGWADTPAVRSVSLRMMIRMMTIMMRMIIIMMMNDDGLGQSVSLMMMMIIGEQTRLLPGLSV